MYGNHYRRSVYGVNMDRQEIQGKIEGILFAVGESVAIKDIAEALQEDENTIKEVIDEMKVYYGAKERGIQIILLEGNVQLRTKDEYYDDLIKIATAPKKNVLSDSVLETLSIIAYKQPVTRMDQDKRSQFGFRYQQAIGIWAYQGARKTGCSRQTAFVRNQRAVLKSVQCGFHRRPAADKHGYDGRSEGTGGKRIKL